jgi:hypothetical protein
LTTGAKNVFLWTFGDGTSSVNLNPSKGFANAGSYQVTLVAIDSVGCMSSLTKVVNVAEGISGPSASFNTDYQVQCLSSNNFNFYNTSSFMGNGWNKKYYWSFGDGTIDTTNTFIFNKKYVNAGNYVVRLVAESADGCKDTMTMYVQVRPEPCTGTMKFVNLSDGTNWQINPDMGGDIASGVAENKQIVDFGMYPNPNSGSFEIGFKENLEEDIQVSVIDILGRELYQSKIDRSGSNQIKIELPPLSNGTYILMLRGERFQYSDKKFSLVH